MDPNLQPEQKFMVTTRDGLRGVATPTFMPGNPSRWQFLVRFENGQQITVPSEALTRQTDGNYIMPLDFAHYGLDNTTAHSATSSESTAAQQVDNSDRLVIPVIAEQLQVEKRQVQTGGVRVRKLVHEHQETVEEPLLHEEVNVERVPINRVVTEPVSARYEGDTLIIPVLEETLVVEKQLVLKEELRVSKKRVTTSEPQEVTLRSEEVVLEQLDNLDNNQPHL